MNVSGVGRSHGYDHVGDSEGAEGAGKAHEAQEQFPWNASGNIGPRSVGKSIGNRTVATLPCGIIPKSWNTGRGFHGAGGASPQPAQVRSAATASARFERARISSGR